MQIIDLYILTFYNVAADIWPSILLARTQFCAIQTELQGSSSLPMAGVSVKVAHRTDTLEYLATLNY
jgi:hypothetical protein